MNYPNRVIKKGEKSKSIVKALQKKLNEVGCGPIDVDGDFGPNTFKAVKQFQATRRDQNGNPLEIDGKVGSITWSVLFGQDTVPIYFRNIADHFHNVIMKSVEYKTNTLKMVRKSALLEPLFRHKIENLFLNSEAAGLRLKRMETFRSNGKQQDAYNSGHSKIRSFGMHHFGIAQDIICLDQNGKSIDNGDAREYQILRQEAVKLGINLLGTWDAGHMQGISVNMQNAMRQFVLNYHEPKYLILTYGMENHFVMNLKIALAKLGYRVNQDDMFFGNQTEESLRKFQTDKMLDVNGIAGKQVYDKMMSLGHDLKNA